MNGTVLIVEDESVIADTLQYALNADGFDSKWVVTGKEALESLSNQALKLVILDIGLPDINGLELLKEIRKRSDVPVVFLTARDSEIDRVVGLEIGADDYVTKPFSPREIVARIKAILKRVEPKEQVTTGRNGHFHIDSEAARILFSGRSLTLTKAEYILLRALRERPGMVFSRSQLMQNIWQHPHPSDERTIDTHVKALRAKIRAIDPQAEPITTHRGLGYSIES